MSANYLFADVKARFAGDLLTIVITEDAAGSKEADTSTSTETEVFANLEVNLGKWLTSVQRSRDRLNSKNVQR